MLAYVTGSVDEELLAQNEYLVTVWVADYYFRPPMATAPKESARRSHASLASS